MEGAGEYREITEGGREWIMELGRGRSGALVLVTGLAEGCKGDAIRGLLLEDAIEYERGIGART
jgi:hypothetical protein